MNPHPRKNGNIWEYPKEEANEEKKPKSLNSIKKTREKFQETSGTVQNSKKTSKNAVTHPHPGILLGTRAQECGKGRNSSRDFHRSHPARRAHPLLGGKGKERLIWGENFGNFRIPDPKYPQSCHSLQNPNSFLWDFRGFRANPSLKAGNLGIPKTPGKNLGIPVPEGQNSRGKSKSVSLPSAQARNPGGK